MAKGAVWPLPRVFRGGQFLPSILEQHPAALGGSPTIASASSVLHVLTADPAHDTHHRYGDHGPPYVQLCHSCIAGSPPDSRRGEIGNYLDPLTSSHDSSNRSRLSAYVLEACTSLRRHAGAREITGSSLAVELAA